MEQSFLCIIVVLFHSFDSSSSLSDPSAPQILPLFPLILSSSLPFNSFFLSFVERISSLSSMKQTSDNNWQDERATPESISFLPLPSSCFSFPLLFWVEEEICHLPDRMYHSSLFFFSLECIIVVLVEKREIEEKKKHLTVAATKQNKKKEKENFLTGRRKRLTTSLLDGQTLKPTFFCSRQKWTKNHIAKKNTRSGQFCEIRYWSLFWTGKKKRKEG